jgi:CrcB protein
MNSDVEVSRTIVGVPASIRIRPEYLLLAAAGGAVGTLVRFGLTLIAPSWHTINAGTVAVNLIGPFLLGVLLQALSVGLETPQRRSLRLLAGVGFLGALTSYAELALDIVTLLERGELALAIGYGVLTIAFGALATWAGIVVAARLHGRIRRPREEARG